MQGCGDAIALAEQALTHEPEAEPHHRTPVLPHDLDRDTARARAAFDAMQRLLEVELGARPSAETLTMMQLVDQAAAAALAPARVWATAPQRPPRMVGRRRVLKASCQTLADRCALLLVGEAGAGKTRLLAEVWQFAFGHGVVTAQAGDTGVPHYITLTRLLRHLLPDIGPVASTPMVPLPTEMPIDCAPGCWWHALWRLSQQLRDSERTDAARAGGVAWIHRTLHNERPSECHASFRHAVPAQRELLAG